MVLIRERSFGKQRGNNNLGLILLLLAKYHPSPLCMRSLAWLFSKLIAEAPGSYAVLTCSDKPLASFGAKRDISPRSAALTKFPLPLQREAQFAPPDHLGWCVRPPPGASVAKAFCRNSLLQESLPVFYYRIWTYNGTLRSIAGWSRPFLCLTSHPTLPPMLECGFCSSKMVPSHPMPSKIQLVCALWGGRPIASCSCWQINIIAVREWGGYVHRACFVNSFWAGISCVNAQLPCDFQSWAKPLCQACH